ncbi:helix-turn-helix domain-containing protein [Streptomyces sp. NPDC055059]
MVVPGAVREREIGFARLVFAIVAILASAPALTRPPAEGPTHPRDNDHCLSSPGVGHASAQPVHGGVGQGPAGGAGAVGPLTHRPAAAREWAEVALAAAERTPNAVIARRSRLHIATVRRWRKRFHHECLAALDDCKRPGRPRRYGPDVHLAIIVTDFGQTRYRQPVDIQADRQVPCRPRDLHLPGRADPGRPGPQARPGPRLADPPRRPGLPRQGRRGVRPWPVPSAGVGGTQRRREDRHAGPLAPTPVPPRTGTCGLSSSRFFLSSSVEAMARASCAGS